MYLSDKKINRPTETISNYKAPLEPKAKQKNNVLGRSLVRSLVTSVVSRTLVSSWEGNGHRTLVSLSVKAIVLLLESYCVASLSKVDGVG